MRQPTPGSLRQSSYREDLFDDIIDEAKIAWAIDSFDQFKSPGPDGIIPAMLLHSVEIIVPVFNAIFKMCLCLSFVPDAWKKVLVVFITKSGKLSHVKPKDYRPISLSSFLMKVLERLIDIHVRGTMDSLSVVLNMPTLRVGQQRAL